MSKINEDIFEQLLEIDDDDSHEFSKSIIVTFFEQLDEKVPEFDKLLEKNDYLEISRLGHFLKGSSANIGAETLRKLCEDINHYELYTSGNEKAFLEDCVIKIKKEVPIAKTTFYSRLGLDE